MILRFVRESILRAPRRKALMVAAIAMGSAVATAMLCVMLDIGDKINRELRSEGANIVVTSRAAALQGGVGSITADAAGSASYIPESDVPKIKAIFWGLNITGFSPSLGMQDGATRIQGVWFHHPYRAPDGSSQFTGIHDVNPAWELLRGRWPEDVLPECVAGATLARRNRWKVGDEINLSGSRFKIVGILSSGEEADDEVFMPMAQVQKLTNRTDRVERIDVAALTKAEDDFARKDPGTMTAAEYERWSCANYAISIAHEIEQALPGTEARLVRRVADSEGRILDRVSGLMALITFAALFSAGLTVWSLTATTMMERRGEVAIMQAIGGAKWVIGSLFGLEIALVGSAGGVIGVFVGVLLAHFVGQSVFHESIQVAWIIPVLIVFAAIFVALAGAAQPLRRTMGMDPASILREGV